MKQIILPYMGKWEDIKDIVNENLSNPNRGWVELADVNLNSNFPFDITIDTIGQSAHAVITSKDDYEVKIVKTDYVPLNDYYKLNKRKYEKLMNELQTLYLEWINTLFEDVENKN